MVMMPQPATAAIRHVRTPEARVIYLSPQGKLLTAAKSRAAGPGEASDLAVRPL